VRKHNVYDRVPDDSREEVFEVLAQSGSVKIERIVSSGQSSPAEGWYDQALYEWVIVLRGEASIQFEDDAVVDLSEGDYINIPAHKRHRVVSTSVTPETIWLAVHY
jgi:cupin 2 domain-containing protein